MQKHLNALKTFYAQLTPEQQKIMDHLHRPYGTWQRQGAGVGYDSQTRYSIAYQQRVYAGGNQLPGQCPAQRSDLSSPSPY